MNIAVVGATGMVGTQILKVLAENSFPITNLLLVASEKSIGNEIEFFFWLLHFVECYISSVSDLFPNSLIIIIIPFIT